MRTEDLLNTIEILCSEHGKLNAIIESSYEGIFEIDQFGNILYANPSFCKIFEVTYGEVQSKNFFEVVDSPKLRETILELFWENKKFISFKLEIPSSLLSKKYLELKMMSITLRDKTFVIGIVLDQTELIRALKNREYYISSLYRLIREIKVETKDTIYHLAKLVEIHDHSTGKHLERIEHYTRLLALDYWKAYQERDPHLTEQYVEDLAISSVLHDIGKVGVSDTILLKPEKLTVDEFEVIKQHTTIVGEALMDHKGRKDFLSLGREIAFAHHERWDGKGYPKGLYGDQIPLSARIISICDVYDALASARPYKLAMPHEEAVNIILGERGKAFDPEIVDLFAKIHPKFKEIREQFTNGTPITDPGES